MCAGPEAIALAQRFRGAAVKCECGADVTDAEVSVLRALVDQLRAMVEDLLARVRRAEIRELRSFVATPPPPLPYALMVMPRW
jgi:hypothetical protein